MSVSSADWRTPAQVERERSWLARIRKGDQSTWAEVYDDLAPQLFRRILMPRLANSTAAEDALSETFRAAIERIGSFEETGSGLYPWLARIAANKAMDMHRARAITQRKLDELGRVTGALSAPVMGAADLLELKIEQGAMKTRVELVLARLNPRYRTTIELRFFRNLSREDCARELDIKLGTFDVLLLRALRSFKKVWQELVTGQELSL